MPLPLTSSAHLATIALGFALAILLAGAPPAGAQQGVTKSEIVVGTVQDLSGPLAPFGKAIRNGMQMTVAEVNEGGGIHGRMIKLLVEDSGYQTPRGVAAAKKLVTEDHVFAMVGTLGAEIVEGYFPLLAKRNVPNLFPASASRRMYDPLHRLKFSVAPSFEIQMRSAVKWLAKERGAKKFCAILQEDNDGEEVLRGAELGLRELNLSLADKARVKSGATDLETHMTRFKEAGCDTLLLGTILKETIGAVASAKKVGWNPHMMGTSAAYIDLIHKLGGSPMEGLYATYFVPIPYADDSSRQIRDWAWRYKARYNEDPSIFSLYGYGSMLLFSLAAIENGPKLSTESLIKTLETMTIERDPFGGPELRFSPTQRLATRQSRIAQIQKGRWKPVTGLLND